MSSALEVVRLVNTLATIAIEYGISFNDLARRQQKAEMEGRAFGVEDLEAMREEAKTALDRLNEKLP